jgi:transcriptional regulator with GAF, ATPase, and Fis domain
MDNRRESAATGTYDQRSAELLKALTRALEVLGAAGDEVGALAESFDRAASAFAAEKALLLRVRRGEGEERTLECLRSVGLSLAQVRACVGGESLEGVSASRIRQAIETLEAQLVENSQFEGQGAEQTGSLRGRPHSVLCVPVSDPYTRTVIAVLYFQTAAGHGGYTAVDLPPARAYAMALGHAFGLFFTGERRYRALEEDWRRLQRERAGEAPEIIGDSEGTQRLRDELNDIYLPALEATTPGPILILGETGTGKDLVARYLHYYSATRGRAALIEYNCAGLSGDLAQSTLFGHARGAFTGATGSAPGLFRAAHQGVLFLDEIGALPPQGQDLLLKVLDRWVVQPVGEARSHPVDVQLLCATNRDLAAAVKTGAFRHDLYQRLKSLTIRLVPLAQRPGDLLPLVSHFLAQAEKTIKKRTRGLAPDALRLLLTYTWPGNVRELAGVCLALVTHARPGEVIAAAAVRERCPEVLDPGHHADERFAEALIAGPFYEARTRFERDFFVNRLEIHGWNVPEAARSMGLSAATLYRYLQRHGLKRADSGA